MEEQVATILDLLRTLVPRIKKLEQNIQIGGRNQEPQLGGHSSASAETYVMVSDEDSVEDSQDIDEPDEQVVEHLHFQAFLVETAGKKQCDRSESEQKSCVTPSENYDSESDQSSDANLSGSSDVDFSDFANFQQQYENENLSQQELEDMWEQFNSSCIQEDEESCHSPEQEDELEMYSSADENESLDPGGCQSPFSDNSEISTDN